MEFEVKGRVCVRLPLLYNNQSLIFPHSIPLNTVCVRPYGFVFTVRPHTGLMAETATEVR